MTLQFDTARAPLSAADREALVRAVSRAHATDETVWLEWKGQLDLSVPEGRMSVARCILGFANRLPEVARRFCEGRAFMVVGAEPGQVRGIEPIDAAVLEPRVNAYLGDGPRWTPHWVAVDGARVLVVEVSAPQPGDPIHCLAKEYDRYRNGDIFVRRLGATERASATEVRSLVERAKGGAPRLSGLRLEVSPATTLTPVDFSQEAREAWLEQERQVCLTSLHRHRAEQRRAESQASQAVDVAGFRDLDVNPAWRLRNQMADIAAAHNWTGALLGQTTVAEDRSEEQYEQQVERYIERCREELPDALRRAAAAGLVPVEFVVLNDSDDNYAEVVVEVYCPGDVDGTYSRSYVTKGHGMPDRPRRFGPRTEDPFRLSLPSYSLQSLGGGPVSRAPSFEIERGGSVNLTFDPVDVRPQRAVRLPEAILLPAAGLSGVVVEWSATSSSVSGEVRGVFELPVAGEPWLIDEALTYEGPDTDD